MAPDQRNERQKPFHKRQAAQTSKVDTLCKVILAAAEAEYGIKNPLAQQILSQAQQENRDLVDVLMDWFLLHRTCVSFDAETTIVYHVDKHAHLPQELTMKHIRNLRLP